MRELLLLGVFFLSITAGTSPPVHNWAGGATLMVAESASDIDVELAEPDPDLVFASMDACLAYARAQNRQASKAGRLTHVYCLDD